MRKFYSLLAVLCLVLISTKSISQTINDTCRADFERVPLTTIDVLTAGFRALPWDSTEKKPEEICWSFGDTHDTCIKYDPSLINNYFVSHTYGHTGIYNVCVRILYQGGCLAYKCKYIQIGEADSCSIKFETLNSTSNILGRYVIAQPWINTSKKPLVICWDFGDAHDTCIQYPTSYTDKYAVFHSYAHSGNYNVCVKVQFDGGCESHYCNVIQVGELPDSCSADFEVGLNSTTPLGRHFSAIPWNSNNKKPIYVCWNFGDQHDTCIQYSNTFAGPYGVNHIYAERGQYEVCVRIVYDGGCDAKKCKVIQVGEQDSCSVTFETLSQTSNALGKYFIAKPWNSNNKKPLSICWNFGDNRDTCIQYATTYTSAYAAFHLYLHAGIYNVCVKIHYDGGCESYYCNTVQVGERDSCSVSFETISATNNALRKYFIAKPWNSNNKKPLLICWNFGDNHDTCVQYATTYTGTYVVSHTYLHSGTYNVCVKIQYDGGCASYYCHLVQVGERDTCSVSFETITQTSNVLGKYFIAKPWNSNNKKPLSICWNFGDNRDTCIQYTTTYTGAYAVFHRYEHAGIYNVCVKVHFDGGCESYYCHLVQVGEPDSCKADFERIPVSPTSNPARVYYRALPWNNHEKKPAQICWSFGDGRDTCISYPENYTGVYVVGHNYDRSGMYEVCVKIYYYGGCEAKKCKTINIFLYECRVHLYQIVSSVTSLTRGFYFATGNDARVTRVCWSFGDGDDTCINVEPNATDIPRTIKHEYPGPGVYRTCVKVLFASGCTASDCVEVTIRSLTDLCGGYYTDSLINPRTYSFKGFSIHKPDDAVISYRWTFGDGSSGIGERITHTYNAPGVYRVCLLINTEKGCETKICNDVRIAGETQVRIQLTPNPVVNTLHAVFYSTHTETVKIKIINANGVVVTEYSRDAVVGANFWEFDVSGLLPGVYSFVVQSSNQFASGIFFKL